MHERSFSQNCYAAFIEILLRSGFDSITASKEWDHLIDKTR